MMFNTMKLKTKNKKENMNFSVRKPAPRHIQFLLHFHVRVREAGTDSNHEHKVSSKKSSLVLSGGDNGGESLLAGDGKSRRSLVPSSRFKYFVCASVLVDMMVH